MGAEMCIRDRTMKNAEERSGTNTGGCIRSMVIGKCQKKLLIFALSNSRHCTILGGLVFVLVFFAFFQNLTKIGNI